MAAGTPLDATAELALSVAVGAMPAKWAGVGCALYDEPAGSDGVLGVACAAHPTAAFCTVRHSRIVTMVQSTHSGALSSMNKRSAPSSFSSSSAAMPLRRGCIAALNRSAGYTAVTASWPGNSKSVMAGEVRFMATTADVTSVCAASCSSGACALVVKLTSGAAFRSITSAAASLNASVLIAQRHTVLDALWHGNGRSSGAAGCAAASTVDSGPLSRAYAGLGARAYMHHVHKAAGVLRFRVGCTGLQGSLCNDSSIIQHQLHRAATGESDVRGVRLRCMHGVSSGVLVLMAGSHTQTLHRS